MPVYEFMTKVYISADSEEEAKLRAQYTDDNIKEVTQHAPFTCTISIDINTCEESDYDPEDEYYEDEQ